MPKIPLYNKSGASSVETPAGSLGPRASSGVFTSQGQALAQFGQQVSKSGQAAAESMLRFQQQKEKIDFDFAMAEKDAETQRNLNDATVDFNEQSLKFIEENKDTDTTRFRTAFEGFTNDYVSKNIDNRADLTDSQKLKIKSGLNGQITSKSNQGAKNAFDRMQVVRGQSAKDSLATKIQMASQFSSDHPERLRIFTEIENDIIAAERDGLRTGYSVQSVKIGFETGDFNNQILNSTNFQDLDRISSEVDKSSLGANGKFTMKSRINTRKSEIRSEAFQTAVTSLGALEVTFDDRDSLEQDMINGVPIAGTDLNGDPVTVDTSVMKPSQRVAFANTYLPAKFEDVADVVSQTLVGEIFSTAETGGSTLDVLESASSLYSQESMSANNKDESDMDAIVLETAQQMAQQAQRDVASGSYDSETVLSLLNASQAVIEQSLGGRTPLVRGIGKTGDSASTISNTIVSARATLAKAEKTRALLAQGGNLLSTGRLGTQDIGLTGDQEQSVIAAGLQNIDTLEGQINLLSDNDVEFKQWTGLLSTAKNRILDPSVTEMSEDVRSAIQIATAISLQGRDGVYENHIKDSDRTFWNSWKTLTSIHEPEIAFEMMKSQRRDADINLSFQDVSDKVAVMGEELYDVAWYKDAWNFVTGTDTVPEPLNTGQITGFVSDLSKEYIRFNIAPDVALDLAARDYFKTHIPVGNLMLRRPKNKSLTANLPAINDILVEQFLEANPDSPFEPTDLAIMNVGNSDDIWTITHSGGLPTFGYENNRFNLQEMSSVLSEAGRRTAAEALSQTKTAIKENTAN